MPLDNVGQRLKWLGHAGFVFRLSGKTVYLDPYRIGGEAPPADVVLVTHDHYDHFSPDDLGRIAGERTTIVAPATVTEQIKGRAVSISAGETVEVDGIEVEAVAAYNTNKQNSEGRPFHPREAGGVGYVITGEGMRIYHAGDTDVIPEMDQATGVDVALLPVSGTYVMTAVEAVEAARRIQPKLAIPMHWGTIVGSQEDAEQFARAAPVEVLVPEEVGEAIGTQ
jgi:L-ascorbate metabolism protein UlaG (beta-lactamase superfamily)